jgi:hypothetical protein
MSRSLEIKRVSREIAELSLAEQEQDGLLNVRQKERLRRAIATAGEELGWGDIETKSGDPLPVIHKAMLRMAKNGAKAMAKDLDEHLTAKKKETRTLEKMKESLRKRGEDPKTEFPIIETYNFSARDASQLYVTKTENLELNEASEAISAADGMERSTNSRAKLTDLMILDLKHKQVRQALMTKNLSEFVEAAHPVIRAVLHTLV